MLKNVLGVMVLLLLSSGVVGAQQTTGSAAAADRAKADGAVTGASAGQSGSAD
jgi:hypothetical protein